MDLDLFAQNNKFLMFAFDHRGSFKKLMNPEAPDAVTPEMAIALKKEIIESVEDQFSGILIDTEYGLPAYNKAKPFLLPVEKTGYTEDSGERVTELEYGLPKLQELGAKGAKLLIYFNPYIKSAEKQLATAKQVADECRNRNYPLFLEIVTYEPGEDNSKDKRSALVLDSVKMFLDRGIKPDVYKLEYPQNAESCLKITQTLKDVDIPWIILTRGVSFDEFVPQLQDAMQGGAMGFLAGRALWKEVCNMQGEEKAKFLKETHPERFKKICEIALAA